MVAKLKDHRVVKVASYNEHTAALIEPLDDSGNFYCPSSRQVLQISSLFMQNLKEMLHNPEFSDVTFIVEGRQIYAHKIILSRRCEHFAAMFRSGMRESHESTIEMPNVSYDVFMLVLEYLYTDSVKIEVDYAIEFYLLADLYQISRIKEMCILVIKRNLSSENAAKLLQASHDAHCQILKDICMEYIVVNFDFISKSEDIKVVSHGLLLEILAMRP